MKRYVPLVLIFLAYFALTSCSSTHLSKTDISKEHWMREVDTNPMKWTRGADNWFLTGDPNAAEIADRHAPYSAAISTLSVRVPDFTDIKVNGDFQVQIFGTYGHNSVYVYGPNNAVREVAVEVKGNTLCVNQSKKVPRNMGVVIIRIGVNQLNKLIQLGCGTVEGIRLRSQYLVVASRGSGNVYLSGQLNLQRVFSMGAGSISVFGANTPVLGIKTTGNGSVNISGNVGIKSILHQGRGNINIIGANSAGLQIDAAGSGKIGINGIVNLRAVRARGQTRVYVYKVASNRLHADAHDRARIGLLGSSQQLFVNTFRSSCFGGKYLCAREAYVRSYGSSHINVSATNKIFAAAAQNSSIYFFGSPQILSQFGNGMVIPIGGENICRIAMHPTVYKHERISYKGEDTTLIPDGGIISVVYLHSPTSHSIKNMEEREHSKRQESPE